MAQGNRISNTLEVFFSIVSFFENEVVCPRKKRIASWLPLVYCALRLPIQDVQELRIKVQSPLAIQGNDLLV